MVSKTVTKTKQTEVGKIPEYWEVKQLKDISSDVSYGYTASASEERVGPKFLRITDIVPYFIDWEKVPFCKISDSNREKYSLDVGDIVVARTGANTGANAIIKLKKDAVFASYLIRFRINTKRANPFFVSYILKSCLWQNYIESIVGGSAQPGANAKQLGFFRLPIASFQEQKKIVKILSDLDSKNEINLQMNITLEAIGQAVFRRWFVDFEFPNENGLPYRSSGGKMTKSDLGEIPKGWKIDDISKVTEVIDCLHSKKPERTKDGKNLLQVFNIEKNGELNLDDFYYVSDIDYDFWTRKIEVKKGDLIISKTGRVGAIAQIPEGLKFGIGRNLVAIRPTKIPPTFTLEYLLSTYGQKEIQRLTMSGTILRSLHVKYIKTLQILVPPSQVINLYEKIARPLRAQIENNLKQNIKLTCLRETLLPKLMSGKIRVPIVKDNVETF